MDEIIIEPVITCKKDFYLCNSRVNSNQVVEIRFSSPKLQTDGKALGDFTSVGGEDMKANHLLLQNFNTMGF